jgi:hypothetical protein
MLVLSKQWATLETCAAQQAGHGLAQRRSFFPLRFTTTGLSIAAFFSGVFSFSSLAIIAASGLLAPLRREDR